MFQIQSPGEWKAASDWLGSAETPWGTPSGGYGSLAPRVVDGIRPLWAQPTGAQSGANPPNGTAGAGLGAGFMQQVLSMLGSLLSALFGAAGAAGASQGGPSGANGFDPLQKFYTNAAASSVGDPHLHFEGTTGAGNHDAATWDNMNGHAHFLTSDSIAGGFDLATEVTAPAANGATMNRRVTLATNGGATSVNMDNAGGVSILQNGTNVPIGTGQTVDLGNGETATSNADGSLSVTADAVTGGRIVTTMRAGGGGVDVNATATNVDLGGYAVRHTTFAQAVP